MMEKKSQHAFPSKMNIATAPESVEIKASCLPQFSTPKSHLRPETQQKPVKIMTLAAINYQIQKIQK